MSFQAYIDNIKTKTGKTPEDFKKIAEKKGLLKPGVKAGKLSAGLRRITASGMATPWQSTPPSKG